MHTHSHDPSGAECLVCGHRQTLRERLEGVPVGERVQIGIEGYRSYDTLRGALYNAARSAKIRITVKRDESARCYIVERIE